MLQQFTAVRTPFRSEALRCAPANGWPLLYKGPARRPARVHVAVSPECARRCRVQAASEVGKYLPAELNELLVEAAKNQDLAAAVAAVFVGAPLLTALLLQLVRARLPPSHPPFPQRRPVLVLGLLSEAQYHARALKLDQPI